MRIRAVLTDLDGTLLEPDGSVCAEALAAIAALAAAGVPVLPVTSKTAAELAPLLARLAIDAPAGCENGAVVRLPGGTTELLPGAVPLADLAAVLEGLRGRTAAPVRTLLELSDAEMSSLTGLDGAALALARRRQATLPLVVEPAWDDRLRAALPERPRLRLVRGNRFLHLHGDHAKDGAVPRLLAVAGARDGAVVACGDAPNDAELLARADLAVIVPGSAGPSAELRRCVPSARVAPHPHGRGWAAAMTTLLAADDGHARGHAARPRTRGAARS
ncbi:MAG TPA: HAD-IIB family hydrolase [Thermoanaerobaculaceae bacterium]|nr:HAD-IIB family hydrolase [Thermoanaerobaculaceae bacterium]